MKLAEVKSIKVGEKTFPIKLTQRAMNEYEELTGETIASFKGSERMGKLFYCTAKAGARDAKHDFKYTYEQFLDVIDDYYVDTVNNFMPAVFDFFGISKEGPGKKQ